MAPGYRATVLVEEFAAGTEISVDAAVRNGRLSLLVQARKQLGFASCCIEVGHYVDAADPLRGDERIAACCATRTPRWASPTA